MIDSTLANVFQIYLEYKLDNNTDQTDKEDKDGIDASGKYYQMLIFWKKLMIS